MLFWPGVTASHASNTRNAVLVPGRHLAAASAASGRNDRKRSSGAEHGARDNRHPPTLREALPLLQWVSEAGVEFGEQPEGFAVKNAMVWMGAFGAYEIPDAVVKRALVGSRLGIDRMHDGRTSVGKAIAKWVRDQDALAVALFTLDAESRAASACA